MQDRLVHDSSTIPANTKKLTFLPHNVGRVQEQPCNPLLLRLPTTHAPFRTKLPQKVVLVSVYETKLTGAGGVGNPLKGDGHLKICPLGHIQLFPALRGPSFKVHFGKFAPRQYWCVAW